MEGKEENGDCADMKALWVALVLVPGVAWADPPPVGSDDWNVMHPYKEWVESQRDGLGRSCCSTGDGRPVHACIASAAPHTEVNAKGKSVDICPQNGPDLNWWVHIEPKHWADSGTMREGPPWPIMTDHWAVVPEEKITRGLNPTGTPILWLYEGRIQCYAEPAGT